MPTLSNLERLTLVRCADDHTGLWEIIRDVRSSLPDATAGEIQTKTLEILESLLQQGLIQAGFSLGRKFDPWLFSVRDTLDRIRTEWDAHGRDPSLGEVAWFSITPNGTERLKQAGT